MTDPVRPQTDECWRICYHEGDVKRVQALLDAGVEIDRRAPCSGSAPLDASIWGGHMDLFRFLVERGADVNGVGYSDHTALMAATNQVLPAAMKLLLERGADPNLASPTTGETPLHQAASHGYRSDMNACMELLLKSGANPNVRSKPGQLADTYISGSVELVGETPLHLAAAYGDAAMIRMLIQAGADVSTKDAQGQTPFNWYGKHRRDVQHLVVPRDEGIARELKASESS